MANINKDKKYHFLYKTVNLLTEMYYVGIHSTSNMKDGYLGSGKRLRRSIRKHGKENFRLEILEFFDSRESLVEREKQLVNELLLQDPKCMNLKPGGLGGFSKEVQQLGSKLGAQRRAELLKTDLEFRNNFSSIMREATEKARQEGKLKNNYPNWTGRKHRPETIEKMRGHKRQSGEKNNAFGTMLITDGTSNKRIKKETEIPEGWYKGVTLKKK